MNINLNLDKKDRIILCFILAWIALYLALIVGYSVNIPYGDDYDNGLLLSIVQMSQAHHIGDFIRILIEPHNEHRIAVTRLIGYVQYLACGELNFRIIILIANLLKLGLFVLLIRLLPKLNMWSYLVITLFFFQLSDSESAVWAMTGLSAYSALLLALITLIFIDKAAKWNYFILACLFSILTVFSNGNGLVVLFAALLFLLLKKHKLQFFIYLIFAGVMILCYFHGYKSPNPLTIELNSIAYFLVFLGDVFKYVFHGEIYRLFFCAICGLALLLFTVKFAIKNNRNVLLYFALFAIFSGVLATIARTKFGVPEALSSRYTMYSVILGVIFYGTYISGLTIKTQKIVNIIIILFTLLSFSHGLLAIKKQNESLNSSFSYCNNKLQGFIYPSQARAREIIAMAESSGVYNIQDNIKIKPPIVTKCKET